MTSEYDKGKIELEVSRRDISATKQLDIDLQRLASIIESSGDFIGYADLDGNVLYVNPAGCRMAGLSSAQDPRAKRISDFVLPEDLARVEQEIMPEVFANGHWHGEFRLKRFDGGTVPLEMRVFVIRDPHTGQPVGTANISRDISERKRIDEELEKYRSDLEHQVQERTTALELQNRRNELILNNTADGLCITTEGGRIVDANAAYCRMLGYTLEELRQLCIPDIEGNESSEDIARHLERIFAQGYDRFDSLHRHKDGSLIPVEITVSMSRIGEERMVYAFVRDISERKRAEQALINAKEEAERASRVKSEFLSRMSHELRTPMNAILGFSQVLEIEPLTTEQQSFVREIGKAGEHLLELINELLDLSRIEAGRMEMVIEPVSLAPVIERCETLVKPLLQQRKVRLLNLCDPGITVLADATRLRQVLLNLLSNATKYNRPGGSISLECKALDGDLMRISVSDTGSGIAREKQEYLFTPFERLGAQFTEVEGAGIGLALSKRLTELMGGKLGVESTEGQGTTFWLDLPKAQDEEAAVKPVPITVHEPTGSKYTVLYVEDNAANLRVVEAMLRLQSNLILLSAMSGEYGLELARHYRPDAILLDIHLPGMDGYGVLEQLSSHQDTSNIPVIALSADAMPIDVERGLAAGFRHYITKPLKLETLLEVLNSVLKD